MKKEVLSNLNAVLNTLGGVYVRGSDNVHRMSDAFKILEGLAGYVSQLPNEVEEESE